jgi:ComF family protein
MDLFSNLARSIPTCCCLCQRLEYHETPNLCETCLSAFQLIQHQCSRCAMPLDLPSHRCGNCLKLPPVFDAAFAAFVYKPPISQLIPTIKQGRDQTALPSLAKIFCNRLSQQPCCELIKATILPVPLHWRRYMGRGFNQSLAISQLIGSQLNLPVKNLLLRRTNYAPSQQGLKRSVRLKNLHSAFEASTNVKDGAFILMDDVMTTGATMNAAAIALKKAGAKNVYAWSLARTVTN